MKSILWRNDLITCKLQIAQIMNMSSTNYTNVMVQLYNFKGGKIYRQPKIHTLQVFKQ